LALSILSRFQSIESRVATVLLLGLLNVASAPIQSNQPGRRIALQAFSLQDVQGLFGGQNLWVGPDSIAYVQLVGHKAGEYGLWETRYRTRLTEKQWSRMESLVGEHHFLTLKTSRRPGVPDEARPVITIVQRTGDSTAVGKWANEKNREFDPIYSFLLDLCQARGKQIYEGNFDWKWRPPGSGQQ
jgi:hypothetical protein